MNEFLADNWQYIVLGFLILENIVRATPCKWDDKIFDSIKSILLKFMGMKKLKK